MLGFCARAGKHDFGASDTGDAVHANAKFMVAGLDLVKGKLAFVIGFFHGNFLILLQHRDRRVCDPATRRERNYATNTMKRLERTCSHTSGR